MIEYRGCKNISGHYVRLALGWWLSPCVSFFLQATHKGSGVAPSFDQSVLHSVPVHPQVRGSPTTHARPLQRQMGGDLRTRMHDNASVRKIFFGNTSHYG